MSRKLKLKAEDAEDLSVISACLQDALVAVGDMKFLPHEHRFVLVANRFCWEAMPCEQEEDLALSPDLCFERVHTGLRFENVTAVRCRGLEQLDAAQVLELLTIREEEGALVLVFAGHAAIRIETGRPLCFLEDLDEPWPTKWRPKHPLEEPGGTR